MTMRHKQSWPLLIRSLRELQHAEVGDVEFDPLARNPMHDPKLRSIGPVQMAFVFDCAPTSEATETMMTRAVSSRFMVSIWIDRC